MLCEGVVGVVAAMRSYPAQRSLLPWQDMFVDLVQGRLQNLFLSLLACETGPVPALLGGFAAQQSSQPPVWPCVKGHAAVLLHRRSDCTRLVVRLLHDGCSQFRLYSWTAAPLHIMTLH